MESYKILIWLWQLKWLVYRKELIKSALWFSLSFFLFLYLLYFGFLHYTLLLYLLLLSFIFYLLSFILLSFYLVILLFPFAFIFLLFFQSRFFGAFSLFPFFLFIVLTSFFFFFFSVYQENISMTARDLLSIGWYLMINNFPMFFSLSTVTRPIFISAPLIYAEWRSAQVLNIFQGGFLCWPRCILQGSWDWMPIFFQYRWMSAMDYRIPLW